MNETAGEEISSGCPTLNVYVVDLWSTVPYYDAYLCQALVSSGVTPTLAAMTYYLDRECFSRKDITPQPGLVDLVGRLDLPKPVRQLLKFVEGLVNLATLTWRFRKRAPDVVHIQYLPLIQRRSMLELRVLRHWQSLGVKVVYTVHDLLPHDSGTSHEPAFRRLYSRVDGLICHSEAVKRELETRFGIDSDRIAVIPHGPFFYDFQPQGQAEVRRRIGVEANKCLVLWQGIIFPYKGIAFLLDAWARLQAQRLPAKLVIAGTGSGEQLSQIEEQVRRLNLQRSVLPEFRFLPVDELMALYVAADVLVYPYRAITSSGALMTGLAQGKAIVTTSLPPFLELLRDGENACIVRYGDAQQLADTLAELIRDPNKRERLGRAVAEMQLGAKSWEKIGRLTAEFYQKIKSTGVRD
jgi:glycosyltransferase involved in cell wall biosynthesis